ncbi:hypothetical protein [Niallia sp.]|uniref:hypothetical protein n=1 Tax=Niallia sp. TaxID=2837523 RepID=UPI0028978C6E|nr:hypothetical protein [Niallia sp.]
MDLNIEFLTNLHKELLHEMYYDYEGKGTVCIDIVTIMGSLFYFEQLTKKARKNNYLSIPVFHASLWEKEKILLEKLIDWIMEEPIHLQFQSIDADLFAPSFFLPNSHEVTLFLDDMESLFGIVNNNYSTVPIASDYIRLLNNENEKGKQEKLATFLRDNVSDSGEIINLHSAIFKKMRRHQSPLSTCVLLSIAAAKTYFNGGSKIYVYQNSKINRNVTIDSNILLKSTHPKTFKLLNDLFTDLDLNLAIQTPILHNPIHTVINQMPKELKLQIKNTVDCVRIKRKGKTSVTLPCGICLPCLHRKIALSASNNEVFDTLYEYDYGQRIADIEKEEDVRILTENLQLLEATIDYLETNLSELASEEQNIAKEFGFAYRQFKEKY